MTSLEVRNMFLMVKQPEVSEGHCHSILVACLDDFFIGDGTTRLGDKLNSDLGGMVN
jgi:hypothetical protein